MKEVSNAKYRMTAKEVLESKLGLRCSNKDIVLLEGGDNGTYVTGVTFRRFGFDRIEYTATYNVNAWDLQIRDTTTDESLYL